MLRRAIHLLRHALIGLSMLGCLLALGTLAVYAWAPSWVGTLDRYLLARYQDPPTAAFRAATARMATDREGAVRQLEALAGDLGPIGPGDRLAPLLTQVYRALLDAQPGGPRAVSWARAWHELSPHDVAANLRLCAALATESGLRHEALTRLRALHGRLPEHPGVTRALIARLLARKDQDGVAAALAAHLDAPRPFAWRVFYLTADLPAPDFNPLQHDFIVPRRGAEDRITASWRMPAHTRAVRFLLPQDDWLTVERAELEVIDGESSLRLPVMIRRPFAEVTLPAPTSSEGATFRLTATLSYRMPKPFANWLRGRKLEARHAAVRRARAWAFLTEPWKLVDGTQERTGHGKAIGTANDREALRVRFELRGAADRLRLHLPPAANTGYRLQGLRLETARGTITLELAELLELQVQDLDREGDLFTVTGLEPRVSCRLPEIRDLRSVTILGAMP